MIMEKLRVEKGIPKERIVSYRFDSMEYDDMTAKQMYTELKSRLSTEGRTYFFLDEMQEIVGWEKVVNSLAADYDVDLYVTGSNSRMMSSEISTYLTGRYVAFQIYTLSFSEYLTFKKQYATLASLENVVYLELCRRGYTVYIGKSGDGEIDFVAARQNEKIYVQVTQCITSEKTEKREYERLLEIHDNYPKYVLRTDEFAGGNYEGIKTMHIADFLLSDEY